MNEDVWIRRELRGKEMGKRKKRREKKERRKEREGRHTNYIPITTRAEWHIIVSLDSWVGLDGRRGRGDGKKGGFRGRG